MRGDWHDLGGGLTEGAGDGVSLQPLARIDDVPSAPGRRLARRDPHARKRAVTPEVKEHMWSALTSLAPRRSASAHDRPAVLLQSNDLKQAMRPIASAGPGAASTPRPSISARHRPGVRDRRADRNRRRRRRARLSLSPDRGPPRRAADAPHHRRGLACARRRGFAGQLREWLKTLRKKNASVIFATQSLSDIDGSAIAPAIIESCQTRILLPNERDRAADYRHLSPLRSQRPADRDHRPGDAQARLLLPVAARQPPVRAGASDVALALCAASSKTDQRDRRGSRASGTDGFLAEWLIEPARLGCRSHSQPHQRHPQAHQEDSHDTLIPFALSRLRFAAIIAAHQSLSRLSARQRRPSSAASSTTRPTTRRTC
jgi:type IV secretion system protein VirB4